MGRGRKEKTPDGENAGHIHEMQRHPSRTDRGHREPVDIHVMHQEHPGRHRTEELRPALDRARQQQEERKDEVSEEEEQADAPPPALLPDTEPLALLRKVGVPDQHVLGEGDVGPEDGEGEDEFAHVVVVLVRDHSPEASGALEQHGHDGQKCKESNHASGEEVDPEDRAVPMRLERHQQVQAGEVGGQGEEHHGRTAEPLAGEGQSEVPRLIRRQRPGPEIAGGEGPDGKVDHPPDGEEGEIQVGAFHGQEGVLSHTGGVCPGIDEGCAQQNRDEEESQPGKIHGQRFGLPADDHAPSSPDQVVENNEKERSQGDREEEGEGNQIGLKKPGQAAGHETQHEAQKGA